MTTIDEILEDAKYHTWAQEEQYSLTEMMSKYAKGESYDQGAFQTTRVTATFMKILDMYIRDEMT